MQQSQVSAGGSVRGYEEKNDDTRYVRTRVERNRQLDMRTQAPH